MSFRKPIDTNVTQRFGADFQQANGSWYYKSIGYQGHNGDDYAAPVGTPVYAADEGTVEFEGWGQNHSWMGTPAGICVLINNGGIFSGYAHLSATCVNAGDHVTKGQQIGIVGSTGAATGPHLHFEAIPLRPDFRNGYAGRIDPQQFMGETLDNATADEVKQAYLDILERTADDEGVAHYTQTPIDFVRSDLASSQEYRGLQERKSAIAAAAATTPAPVIITPPVIATSTVEPTVEPSTTSKIDEVKVEQSPSKKTYLDFVRLAVFALPGLLIGIITNDSQLALGIGAPFLAILRIVDTYIHENPNIKLNGLLPF